MKILATSNFSTKFEKYVEVSVKDKFYALIHQIEGQGNFDQLLSQSQLNYGNVYTYKIDNYRIFFSVEEVTLLFVDIVKKESQTIRNSSKDPSKNPNIDPNRNANINPNRNANINPNRNANINPNRNANINPNRNANINPNRNANINPNRNANINPNRNANINPNRNSAINPSMNPSFNGFYIFDLQGNSEQYIVNANENVILIYDFDNNIKSFGVKHNNGYSLFDFATLQYSGFLSSDGQNGFNQFDINCNWIGYVK